jgi:hypothetical protein
MYSLTNHSNEALGRFILRGAFGSSISRARARVVLPHSPQRAQDDGTAHESRAGALAVDAPDEGLIHYTPAPVPPSASYLRVLPAGLPIIILYMQILGMSSSARRTVFLAPTLRNSTQHLVCGPRQNL